MSLHKFLTIILPLLTCNGIGQVQFGSVKCDSFQLTVDRSEAIIYKGNKNGVFDKKLAKYLIKPTKASILFLARDNLYFVVDQEEIRCYNFYCTDTLMPCKEEYSAQNSLLFNTTPMNEISMLLDRIYYGSSPVELDLGDWVRISKRPSSRGSHIKVKHEEGSFKSTGLIRLNDSLILVQHFKHDYNDPNATPIKSQLYPQEDSLIYDPTTGFYLASYPAPIPGYFLSGVYNLRNKSWFISPNKQIEYYSESGILYADVTRFDVNFNVDSFTYSFKHFGNSTSFHSKSYLDVMYNPFIISTYSDADTLVEIPAFGSGYYDEGDKIYQHIKNGRMTLMDPAHSYKSDTFKKEFVYRNPSTENYFWLENDSIYAEVKGRLYKVSQATGSIEVYLRTARNARDQDYNVYTVEKNDTTFYTTLLDGVYFGRKTESAKCTIKCRGDNLIINNFGDYKPNDVISWQLYQFGELNFESSDWMNLAGSSIWHKQEQGWIKTAENFFSVTPLNFGYLVANVAYRADRYSGERLFTPLIYSFLDENLSPMSINGISEFQKVEIYEHKIEVTAPDQLIVLDLEGNVVNK